MTLFALARCLKQQGNSATDVLRDLVAAGYEYPDAHSVVCTLFRLDADGADELARDYDEQC